MERVFEAWPSVYSRSDLLKYAVQQGCPFPGMPAAGLRALWGEPTRMSGGPAESVVWNYQTSRGPGPISVLIQGDTVLSVDATPWSDWGDGAHLSSAIRKELQLRPDLPSSIPYGLVRDCPQPGTPSAMIVAAYGPEWDRSVATGPPDTLTLRRRIGRHGSHYWWLFVRDSLVDGGYHQSPIQ